MGKSNDKKALREAKEGKKLALGVKRKQLKRKKGRSSDSAVESEAAAEHGTAEDKELAQSKKIVLMKQKKKNKHAKVKSKHARADGVAELLSDSKDDATPKLKKKKTKKKLMDGSSPVKVYESSFVSNDAGTPKLKKKKKKVKEGKSSAGLNDADEILHENQDEETRSADVNQLAAQSGDMDHEDPEKAKRGKKNKTKKVKKSGKADNTDSHASSKENNLEKHVEIGMTNVDEIPSVDEDYSRGMKKWILEYKQKRPGLKVLQERIDEFIVAHEEQQEKERKEREARAAGEGWTVVVHHKGRKKTTDTETGTAVGSVSLAAMQEKIANKKTKEVAPNFYRFQKREAHLSELAMLQSKFEQDKKRIQQLRAQRKFKPY